jgi:ribonuclease HI
MDDVILYTDGACSGNPGDGGWGCVLIYKDNKKELSGGQKDTTNNIMEMTAVIKGLEALKRPCNVNIYSDSSYVVNTFEKGWLENWMKNGWRTSDKKDVKNKDLWMKLYELSNIHNITFNKVKGHSDDELNNRCDELARAAIKNL